MLKRLLTVLAVAATLLPATTAPSSAVEPTGLLAFGQASANGGDPYKCKYIYKPGSTNDYSGVCIAGSTVKYGIWFYLGGRGHYGDATLYVQMCRPDMSACGTISANSDNWFTPSNGYAEIRTSSKPNSYGHVYRTCASMHTSYLDNYWSYVNNCSPWMT